MAPTRKERFVPSTDGIHQLYGVVFIPEGPIRGYFHMVHGMTEYTYRYEEFLSLLAERGYVAFGHDHLGHGRTAKDAAELGYIAEKDGWEYLLKDVDAFSRDVMAEFGEHPYYLAGHSMGSFIVRGATALGYATPEKLIAMGSGGPNPAAPAGILLSDLIGAVKGKRHVSPLLQKLVFRSYDRRFPGDYPHRWLTVDVENLKKYRFDPYCTFQFSVSAMGDLIRLHRLANSARFFDSVSVPVLFLSGQEDPVGNYGKGICRIEKKMKRKKKNVSIKLYSGFRHEILQDFCKEEVYRDVMAFLEKEDA